MHRWLLLLAALIFLPTAAAAATSGSIDSHMPKLIQADVDTEVDVVVRNTGVATSFELVVGTKPEGWSAAVEGGSFFLSNGRTRTVTVTVNPGELAGEFELEMKLRAVDEFGDPFFVDTAKLDFEVLLPPGAFSISTPGPDEQISGNYFFSWGPSEGADLYTLTINELNGTSVVEPAAFERAGLDTTFYQLNVTNVLKKGALYQARVTAINRIASTVNRGGARRFQTAPPAALGAFTLNEPAANATTTVRPTFRWSASTNAQSYSLVLRRDVNGTADSTVLYEKTGITGTEFTLQETQLLGGNVYWATVTAFGEAGTRIQNGGARRFVVTGLTAFTLVAPTDGATNLPFTPNFVWNRSEGASSYLVRVWQGDPATTGWMLAQFSVRQPASGQPSASLPSYARLAPGMTYRWDVTAVATNETRLNDGGSRTMQATALAPFSILSPGSGEDGVPRRPTFSWRPTGVGLVTYRVEVTTVGANGVADPLNVRQGPEISETTWQSDLPDLAPGTTYAWRVLARESLGNTTYNYGNWQNFTITRFTTDFNLTSPAHNSTGVQTEPILDWQEAAGADRYWAYVWIPGRMAFPPIVVQGASSALDLRDAGLQLAGQETYEWTVHALAGVSDRRFAFSTFRFTTRPRTVLTRCDVLEVLAARQTLSASDRTLLPAGEADGVVDAALWVRLGLADALPCE